MVLRGSTTRVHSRIEGPCSHLMSHRDRERKNGFARQPRAKSNNCLPCRGRTKVKGSSPCLIMLRHRSIPSKLIEPKSLTSLSNLKPGRALAHPGHQSQEQDKVEIPLP